MASWAKLVHGKVRFATKKYMDLGTERPGNVRVGFRLVFPPQLRLHVDCNVILSDPWCVWRISPRLPCERSLKRSQTALLIRSQTSFALEKKKRGKRKSSQYPFGTSKWRNRFAMRSSKRRGCVVIPDGAPLAQRVYPCKPRCRRLPLNNTHMTHATCRDGMQLTPFPPLDPHPSSRYTNLRIPPVPSFRFSLSLSASGRPSCPVNLRSVPPFYSYFSSLRQNHCVLFHPFSLSLPQRLKFFFFA